MGNTERILGLIEKRPALDDDEISNLANVYPRQQVNQICRLLEAKGLVRREIGPNGKIVNVPALHPASSSNAGKTPQPRSRTKASPTSSRSTRGLRARIGGSGFSLPEFDLQTSLLIIPCSGSKREYPGSCETGPSVREDLSPDLADRLAVARNAVRERAKIDESTLVPALKRYAGTLYRIAGDSIGAAAKQGAHILIVSGGYGVLLADEPIGTYEARFNPAWWPRGLLEEVIVNYARQHRLSNAIALISGSTSYRKLVERVDWGAAKMAPVHILSPEATPGAMVKAPRAQGEAICALFGGGLVDDWRSSDGLRLIGSRLC